MVQAFHTTYPSEHRSFRSFEFPGAALIAVLAALLLAPTRLPAATEAPAATAAFVAAGRALEDRIPDHLWWGEVFDAFYRNTEDKAAGGVEKVVGRGGHGHATVWTGHYLAAEAYRYAVAKHDGDSTERQKAKERVKAVVGGLHRNANISKNWGTALVPGKPGILMRNTLILIGQIQPASLDLRLGDVAYPVRASFLPIQPVSPLLHHLAPLGEVFVAAVTAMSMGGLVAGVVTAWWQRRRQRRRAVAGTVAQAAADSGSAAPR